MPLLAYPKHFLPLLMILTFLLIIILCTCLSLLSYMRLWMKQPPVFFRGLRARFAFSSRNRAGRDPVVRKCRGAAVDDIPLKQLDIFQGKCYISSRRRRVGSVPAWFSGWRSLGRRISPFFVGGQCGGVVPPRTIGWRGGRRWVPICSLPRTEWWERDQTFPRDDNELNRPFEQSCT